jgi:transcriptional regulator with XRE-family HTH domain
MRRSEFIELGLRLAMIRKRLKLSQRRFATACGISHNYLCELEKGQHQPGYDFLERVINKFKVDFHYLSTGEGPIFQLPPAPAKKEIKAGPVGAADNNEIEKMLGYMERIPVLRYAVLEFFNKYLYKNKGMIAAALKGEEEQEKSAPEPASPDK